MYNILFIWQGQRVCDTLLDGTEVAKDSKTQKQISTLKTVPESGDNLSLVQSSDEDIPLLENQLVNMETYSYKNCLEHSLFFLNPKL
jgi:hypothetical protein